MSDVKYILDSDNKPTKVSFDDYYKWQRSFDDSVKTGVGIKLRRTESNGTTVSTVFLGSDHGLCENSENPVLWETMVWTKDGEEHCERYASHDDAIVGHMAACKKFIGFYLPK